MRKNSCYIKYDWLDIFTEPIQFRVTSRIRIKRKDPGYEVESAFDVIMRKVY